MKDINNLLPNAYSYQVAEEAQQNIRNILDGLKWSLMVGDIQVC